ncbi:MAG TPA: NADH:flavin oxidoreductase [Armatimonadota bacterium]|jgi:2,4-dienoyl-CoA reductase-like NADH-dependent reductase (Old Yellow Enzyme family)
MSMLFSPFEIKGVTFRNRVVMAPMVRGLGDAEGRVTDAVVDWYRARAAAGTGMIIVEATAVDPGGQCWPGGLGAFADEQIPGLRRLAQAIRAEGTVASIQLVHGGPQGSPELCGGEIVGPSAVRVKEGAALPRMLTVEEIQAIEGRFADAAARCVEAGFQAVEIHGAHGFLLDSFLLKARNARSDDYGGLLPHRARMLVETCRRVRERLGSAALLDCRISIFNKIDEDFTANDLHCLVGSLVNTGLDLLHVSTNGVFKGYFNLPKPIGAWVKDITPLPLIVAGGLGLPDNAERALEEGLADFAAVGSAMRDDPEWTAHARAALGG